MKGAKVGNHTSSLKLLLRNFITFDGMIRVILYLFIISIFFSAEAQVQVPAASLAYIQHSAENSISLVAQVNSQFSKDGISRLGGRIGSHIGNIVTLRVDKPNVDAICKYPGIDYIQVAHKITPNLERAVPDLRADSVYTGAGLQTGYTGKDVIIGVTDWGFDYTHPMFYDTLLQHTRILAAWDQFKTSGPHPAGFDYGTEYEGEAELLAAEKDTVNIYGYATHGTHVAGIAGGSGAGTVHRGVAFEANYLFATFLVDEAAVIDAFHWMHQKAKSLNKRLVINMSWGLYNLGPLDGTSLVSQAIDNLSDQGVIFVTSGGNNGDVKFHIKRTFNEDTLQSRVEFYGYSSNPNMWGQSISMWGEENKDFGAGFTVYDKVKNILSQSPLYTTKIASGYVDSFLVVGIDTIRYNIAIDGPHPLNNKPHMRLRIQNKNTNLRIGLKAFANSGTVHFYNVTELTTDVGNWGMPFSAFVDGWEDGDNQYSLGEPASTRSTITVAAHQSEIRVNGNVVGGGSIAYFSSLGPTIDERIKPDISAPGLSIASSISSFTDNNYSLLENVTFNGKEYPFAKFSGTSMSSPATAGVVALMLQANPNLWYDEAKEILRNTAREDNRTGEIPEDGSTQWGWGKVNALGAVQTTEHKYLNLEQRDVFAGNIYPIPARNTLLMESVQVHDVELVSIDGRTILLGQLGNGQKLNLVGIPQGLYWLKFTAGRYSPIKIIKY